MCRTIVLTLALSLAPASGAWLSQLHFSPDGRYILAQGDADLTILTVEPLAILFRIPAEGVIEAQFTADSRQVVFLSGLSRVDYMGARLVNSGAHVERWSVPERARFDSTELELPICGAERLSLDGRFVACVDVQGTLSVTEVTTKTAVIRKEKFNTDTQNLSLHEQTGATVGELMGHTMWRQVTVPTDPSSARVAFSPDSHFFIATPEYYGWGCGIWDLTTNEPVRLRAGLKWLRWGWITFEDYRKGHFPSHPAPFFAFLAPDRLIVSSQFNLKHHRIAAKLLEFPSGRILSRPIIPPGPLYPAADPGFLIVRPFADNPGIDHPARAAAVELSTGKLIISQTTALDVNGPYYVAEPSPGSVRLYERGKGPKTTIALHD